MAGLQIKSKVYMARNSSDNSGCGCLIALILFVGFCISRCGGDTTKNTLPAEEVEAPVEEVVEVAGDGYYDENEDVAYLDDELSEEDALFVTNSLTTGSRPYSAYYGKGYKCPYSQCSAIEVTAPSSSDIVVIIKKDNENGKVIQHGYIRAGRTYSFDIPDGTYQTFFYYGEGWNPNKEMGNGVKGGFVKNEVFSKDYPQEIESAVLTYVLQLQRSGNFQTKSSNKNEMF